MTFEIIIDDENVGVKPKGFIKKNVDVPYFKIVKLIKDKRITLNGKKIKDSDILKKGDVIKVWIDLQGRGKTNKNQISENLGIETIFENQNFLILNKLPNIIVQGSQDNKNSLSLHLHYLKEKNKDNSSFDYIHVHRLDKNTSGVLVVGKNLKSTRELNKIFKSREIVKKYICLCTESFQKKEGEISIKLDRAPEGAKEKVVENESGKETLSFYKVLYECEYKGEVFSMVEVDLKTGFMHQIRVHMKYLGHPIVGDTMYGNSFINRMFDGVLERQFLHAKEIQFNLFDEKYSFVAELTQDLKSFLENFKKI